MKIYSVYDPEFKAYGQIVTGMTDTVAELMEALAATPMPDTMAYVPTDPALQNLPAAAIIRDHCFGGMPVQIGWCNGHNTKLNCLEYHRDSELNLGTEDFILLLAKQDEIADGILDTACVKAFRIPAGVLVECYATTLHYAPCQSHRDKGFRVLAVLPWLTNTEKPCIQPKGGDDALLWARNKWLLAHAETNEAAQGAYVGLKGVNIDIAEEI